MGRPAIRLDKMRANTWATKVSIKAANTVNNVVPSGISCNRFITYRLNYEYR